jgi:hypothetical protein
VLGRALRHPPVWIALNLAKRGAEKICDFIISHLMEIAILKSRCPRMIGITRQMASSVVLRKDASAFGGAGGVARTS